MLDLYGTKGGDGSFASNCLLARRLAERGVRFIQLYHRGWDHHGGIKKVAKVTAELVDQGTAALIKDLKQRGMLDDTLVIWGGEFGRTPMAQGKRPRPPHQGVLVLAGRRRHQAGIQLGQPPTNSATTPSKTSCTSTTCTPRCCICWASTTNG